MGDCSCGDKSNETVTCFSGGESRQLQLVKADSLEEANRLLKKEDHVYLGVFWNGNLSREEYILGRLERVKKSARKVGFSFD